MIEIAFKNGDVCQWPQGSYTDYIYDGKCFIVICDKKGIGLDNIDSIRSIIITEESEKGSCKNV